MARDNYQKSGFLLFSLVLLLGASLLIGCSGDDGAKGETGETGATGEAGPVTTTNESCKVCHSAGKIADIAEMHPDPTGEDQTISNITVTNSGGVPEVSFNVATDSGPVTDVVFDDVRFYIADLVPAETATDWGTWDTPYFERWAYERSSTTGAVFDTSGSANGNYAFTFVTAFGSAAALAEAPDYSAAHTQRLLIRLSGHEDSDGDPLTNNTTGFMDFTVPGVGATATALDSQRMFVTADACKQCHGPLFDEAAHAGSYLDTRACVICHSPLGHYGDEMQEDDAYLPVLVHKIHSAIDMEAFEERIGGLGYSAVTFPQDIRDCMICHTDSGMDLGTGDDIDNWREHPTMEICGSCHTDVNFTTGAGHGGGVQTDNGYCIACHPASGTGFGMSATEAHDATPTGADVPEFDVTISITDPANDSYYVAGETPIVTVVLAAADGGPSADYTAAQDDTGDRDGNLSGANLYVYGPRAKAVPVLTLGSTTDPDFDADTDTASQGHALFVGSDDQVMTDSAGFKYQLLAIPDDMDSGTYMVRFEGADYGGVSSTDYVTSSSSVITFQVGTADEELKVAGDSCYNCHGDTRMHLTGSHAHNAAFDTDACLACHDQSGNHAIPIANRVHAVHSANSDGDIYNIEGGSRDWDDVTFPQDIFTCVACHTSENDTYMTLPYMMPCAGCHAGYSLYWDLGSAEALDHMIQNGGPYIPPEYTESSD